MFRHLIYFIIAVCFVVACSDKNTTSSSKDKLQGLHKFYYPSGELYLEVNYKDSLPDGTFKQYFKSGQLFEQSEYVNGVRHGLSIRYHDNGKISSETPYDSGRIHGIQKKFRREGTPAFEAPYHYDRPCVGLKEYFTSGNERKNFPTIQVIAEDRLWKNNEYVLRITLSEKAKNVEYYRGYLKDGKYITEGTERIPMVNGEGFISYYLSSGGFIMEKLNIIAKVKTELGNYYITQISYNLAAENRW